MDGNRADIVKYEKSSVSRLNPGQFYEQYLTAASRDMSKWIVNNYPVLPLDQVWNKLLAFYQATAPLNHEVCTKKYLTEEKQRLHLQSIIDSGIYLTIPTDSPTLNIEIIDRVEQIIKPTYGPVSYIDDTGKRVTTKHNCFIGQQKFMILEKSDLNPMSISTGYINHHGLLVGANKSARIGHPAKTQSLKVTSETEFRAWLSIMGPEPMVKHMTIANSPDAHKEVVRQIIQSDTPSNLSQPIKIPKYSSRAMMFVKAFLVGFGTALKRGGD